MIRAFVVPLAVGLALLACGGQPVEVRKERKETVFVCPTAARPLDPGSLDDSMMPQLWKILGDDNQRGCWGSAVLAIGYIGADQSFIRLRTFIEGRGAQLALAEDLVLLQQAYLAMGLLAQGGGGGNGAELALEYLIWSTEPANWDKLATHWQMDAVMRRELIRTLTLSAVQALGKLSSEKAHQHLLQMAIDSADRRSLRFKYQEGGEASDVVVHLINLHVLPPGRVAFATTEVLQTMRPGEYEELRRLVERVHADALSAFKLERAWLAARQGEEGYLQAVRKADAIADARLSGLHGQLESLRHLLDSPEDLEAIQRVEQTVFPSGPLALINSDVETQVKKVLAALAALSERFRDEVQHLRLTEHVRTTREAHEELDKAQKLGTSGKGYEAVIQRRSQLQTSLRVLIASVVTHFPGWKGGDRERQHKVLAPILNQDDEVGSYLRRTVPVRDIDPTTGAELAPLVEEGTVGDRTGRRLPVGAEARRPGEEEPRPFGEPPPGERAPDERSPDEYPPEEDLPPGEDPEQYQ